jgi:hypothetical protein
MATKAILFVLFNTHKFEDEFRAAIGLFVYCRRDAES